MLSRESVDLQISGAGPAGLTAAIVAARAGAKVVVHERRQDVGMRFHGDFQGQENWTSGTDVLDELMAAGVRIDFMHTPFHRLVAYDPLGRMFHFTSDQPLFYLVRRGTSPDTLDRALLAQALELGVDVRFGEPVSRLRHGGICAEGPKAGDVIATGYQFRTELPDGAWVALSDDLAPGGYAYLLVHDGQATLASCMFSDFHNESQYLHSAASFFQKRVGFDLPEDAKRFGGLGNISFPRSGRKGNILYVGEAAGFQDALWGFGMRYAMVSGKLAAEAWLQGRPEIYDQLWKARLGPNMRASVVNRYIYSRLGNRGYTRFLVELMRCADVREWLMQHHKENFLSRLLFPWARRHLPSRRKQFLCVREGCSCTWCKCHQSCGVD